MARSCAARAFSKPSTTLEATLSSAALRMVAFSRSSRPSDPTWWLRDTGNASPSSEVRTSRARSSCSLVAGLKAADTAMARHPAATTSAAKRRAASVSSGAISAPVYSLPPSMMAETPMTMSRMSEGQAAPGLTPNEDGAARRSTPTVSRPRRWMMALVGWVVPSMALATRLLSTPWSTSLSDSRMPSMGSGVVATLTALITEPSASMTTASVLVPPTSMPMRNSRSSLMPAVPRSRCRSRRPGARRVRASPPGAIPARRACRSPAPGCRRPGPRW